MELKRFPEAWGIQLNELVNAVRRRPGYAAVYASVHPPRALGQPVIVRLELAGRVETVQLSPRAVEHAMTTGQHAPLLAEIKQAFVQLTKQVNRRGLRASRT